MKSPNQAALALIDIHAHIVPGVDDGARDIDEALAMLEIAAADGVETIVATPHAHRAERDQIERQFEALKNEVIRGGMEIELLLGSEIRLGPEIFDALRDGRYLAINGGPWALMELPLGLEWPGYFDRVLSRLREAGIDPVLAHAERYGAVQRDPNVLRPLIASGVPIQINRDALLGQHGRVEQRTCERLVRLGLAHVLASDAHDARYRTPLLSEAYAVAASLAGIERADAMKSTAVCIARGFPTELWEPLPAELEIDETDESWISRIGQRLFGNDT